ncbi:MAG: hypothetical protein AABX99_03120 [Nanoarchaeota archaeon]
MTKTIIVGNEFERMNLAKRIKPVILEEPSLGRNRCFVKPEKCLEVCPTTYLSCQRYNTKLQAENEEFKKLMESYGIIEGFSELPDPSKYFQEGWGEIK